MRFASEARLKVCGISILTRKTLVTRRFGAEAWASFYRDVAASHPCFSAFVTADTFIPLPAYLAFHDQLMHKFFKNDEDSHQSLGRESSRWALTEGPFKPFLQRRDLGGFVDTLPQFHGLYFDETSTRSEATLTGSSVEFKVVELPQWHPYFEHLVIGYIAEVLEMFCANPIRTVRLRGGAGRDYHYLFHGTPAEGATQASRSGLEVRELAAKDAMRRLSNRELEVLMLVAHGNTNDQIGEKLGISSKTVQHHVARCCRKIGVSGRVGAAVWLAERGLVGT
jgi:DNA-binding CsgD family transcriptional regulator